MAELMGGSTPPDGLTEADQNAGAESYSPLGVPGPFVFTDSSNSAMRCGADASGLGPKPTAPWNRAKAKSSGLRAVHGEPLRSNDPSGFLGETWLESFSK